jgi:hypothetical protein
MGTYAYAFTIMLMAHINYAMINIINSMLWTMY